MRRYLTEDDFSAVLKRNSRLPMAFLDSHLTSHSPTLILLLRYATIRKKKGANIFLPVEEMSNLGEMA